jgi:hypothetical protein
MSPIEAVRPRTYAHEQVELWERFADQIEQVIFKDRERAEHIAQCAMHTMDCDGSADALLDEEKIEALTRARHLCLQEAEQWRARVRANERNASTLQVVKS